MKLWKTWRLSISIHTVDVTFVGVSTVCDIATGGTLQTSNAQCVSRFCWVSEPGSAAKWRRKICKKKDVQKHGTQDVAKDVAKVSAMVAPSVSLVACAACQPFSCPCSQNATHCRKEICSTCLSNESFLANPFGISKHPLSNRSFRFQRAAVRSTTSALWLHHAHPFVAAAEKNIHLMQRSRAFGHGVVVSKVCYNTVIVVSGLLWDCFKPKNICRDWAFSDSGLEV